MRNSFFITVTVCFTLLLTGCNDAVCTSNRYMTLENIEYINSFPETYTLLNGTELDLDFIGINDFCIFDSIMAFSTRNKDSLWNFVSLPDFNPLGSFLTQGEGPFEFIQMPRVSFKTRFFRENGNLFAGIYDSQKGRLLKMNVDESLKSRQLHISMLNDSISPFLFTFIMLDSVRFLCKEVNDTQTQQVRYIKDGNNQVIPSFMEQLNAALVKEGEDINIISTITKINDENNIIVEMPIGLNYINMYSVDGSYSKTICIGKKTR